MSKTLGQMSKLFRSLGSDDAEFQASNKIAAREAEQRWPLFKAMEAKKSEDTPPLSKDARQQWAGEKRQPASRKPALTVPGLGNKLATGLSRLAAKPVARATRRVEEAAETSVEQVFEERTEELVTKPMARNSKRAAPEKAKGGFLSSSPVANPVKRATAAKPVDRPGAKRVTASDAPDERDTKERKLKSVFARLDGDDDSEQRKTEGEGRTFGKRLGKR